MLARLPTPTPPEPGSAWAGDGVFEFWAGNPSVEITHGRIRTATTPPPAAEGADDKCVLVLASSVPCYMSAPEFCDFVGAFKEDTHRRFRHCRVLRGQSPEEYLVAIWLTSQEAEKDLLEKYHGRKYNSIEDVACSIHRIVDCNHRSQSADAPDCWPMSPLLEKSRLHRSNSLGEAVWSPVTSRPSPLLATALPENLPELPASALPPLPSGALPSELAGLFPEHLASFRDSKAAGDAVKCPVCLEHLESDPSDYELTEIGGGVPLTILCGHTFHARCLFRWCDTTCPVCRYQQHPNQTSCCDLCGQSDGIHICLVCGNIGCHEHAKQHYEEQQHTYALDMTTQRVWDFAGNGYVHRLLTNQGDGKVVEHSLPLAAPFGAEDDIDALTATASAAGVSAASIDEHLLSDFAREDSLLRSKDRKGSKKSEGVVSEFNMLLASQMTAQRRYFEEEARNLEARHKLELKDLEVRRHEVVEATEAIQLQLVKVSEDNTMLEHDLCQLATEEEVLRRQMQSLEVLNQKFAEDQRKVEDRAISKEEQRRAARQRRDRTVEDLQQQIRDLELFVQMRKKCEGSSEAADMQGSHMIITESSSRGRGRGGRRPRKH